MPRAVLGRVDARGPALGQREHQQSLRVGCFLPELREVVVLGAEHLRQGLLDVVDVVEASRPGDLTPDEVGEFLGSVGVTARGIEQALQRLLSNPFPAPSKRAG